MTVWWKFLVLVTLFIAILTRHGSAFDWSALTLTQRFFHWAVMWGVGYFAAACLSQIYRRAALCWRRRADWRAGLRFVWAEHFLVILFVVLFFITEAVA